MNNFVYIIGRLVKKESHETYGRFTISAKRDFKYENGEYESDFINCTCFGSSLNYLTDYCNVGDLLIVRGRINVETYEDKTRYNVMVEKLKVLMKKQTTSKPVNEFPNTTSIKQEEIVISEDELPF